MPGIIHLTCGPGLTLVRTGLNDFAPKRLPGWSHDEFGTWRKVKLNGAPSTGRKPDSKRFKFTVGQSPKVAVKGVGHRAASKARNPK